MRISQLRDIATDRTQFNHLEDFTNYCQHYLEFISDPKNIQARIIAQNENQYFFMQYGKEGNYQITRPINAELFLDIESFESNLILLKGIIDNYKTYEATIEGRLCVNSILYTIQQSLGSTLDALPVGQLNKARKINGTLFEKLIVLFLNKLDISSKSESIDLQIVHNNQVLCKMKYQHDLVIRDTLGDVKVIGAIKTTSKDRIDKVFIDKLLYSRLTSTELYHIAIILNDVQRKKTKDANKFSVGSTFLPGRFKGYMIKLCPLDGVYYFDIRRSMQSDNQLQQMIQPFDKLVFDDIAKRFM